MSDLNDPRVFFAAERTLLAWNRTSLAWMAFGFVIERFGLFLRLMEPGGGGPPERGLSFWLGIAFLAVGALMSVASTLQYRKVLKTLKPVEIPAGYRVGVGILVNLSVALLAIVLMVYLFLGQEQRTGAAVHDPAEPERRRAADPPGVTAGRVFPDNLGIDGALRRAGLADPFSIR